MTDFYGDSSVLVKRHVSEIGSNWFKTLTAPANANIIITSRISIIEVYSALNRRVREASINATDYSQIAADVASIYQSEYRIIELTLDIANRARLLLERYALRAYDAVQLASSLAVNDALRASGLAATVFLASDNRLLAAAQSEGLVTDNPNNYPKKTDGR